MKILAIVSTLDLKYRLGCTPAWWQIFKAMHEVGIEVVATPYLGKSVESLWWRTYPNPCEKESDIYNNYLERIKKSGASPSKRSVFSPVFDVVIKNYIKPRWERHIREILLKEKDVDAVLVMNVPMNHISLIPSVVKQKFGIPIIYYDGDMPTSLPKYAVNRGFKFNYYVGADLSEYDAILANSEGCISDLKDMGARRAYPFQYGIDPQLVSPIVAEKDIDISFFGYGSDFREEWIEKLIKIPSMKLPDLKFVVAGGGFHTDFGNAKMIGDLSYSSWREVACRSKINLNITRWSHTRVYASSTSRPFELAGFGACIVSQPYNGIEKWFDVGNDLMIVQNEDEAINAYRNLLTDDAKRNVMGNNARQRVLKEHTFQHRARQLLEIINEIKSVKTT
jgi:spore maturation protein CgeB